MAKTPERLTASAHLLLTHLLTTPDMAQHLRKLHELALYESGDALLGSDEKKALLNAKALADFLDQMDDDDFKCLRSLL